MTPFEWIAVAVVSVLSASRITRLVTYDAFPPAVRVRMWWDKVTKDGEWALLFHCAFCASFWITLAVLGAGWASDWHPAWWFVNGVFGASYLAAMVMLRDGDE